MATYEKGFVDRISNKINAKVISVTEQNIYSDGHMKLVADVTRDDRDVTTVGTRLNAAEMNKAVLDLVYNDLFGIQIDTDLHNIKMVAEEEFTFKITCNERPLFANCICTGGIEFTGENLLYEGGGEITIIMTASESLLSDNASKDIDFKIELYTDRFGNNYLVTVTGCIEYHPSSQSSTD